MTCEIPKRTTGKGTRVSIQPCTDESTLGCSAGFTLINGVCVHDTDRITFPDEEPTCFPGGFLMDWAPTANAWLLVGCVYELQPPGYDYTSDVGEMCLQETGNPPIDLGDENEDNPSFMTPFSKSDIEFRRLRDWITGNICLGFWFEYPSGGADYFYGKLKTNKPASLTRTDYTKNNITIMRTSKIYHNYQVVPVDCDFDCNTCRECNV